MSAIWCCITTPFVRLSVHTHTRCIIFGGILCPALGFWSVYLTKLYLWGPDIFIVLCVLGEVTVYSFLLGKELGEKCNFNFFGGGGGGGGRGVGTLNQSSLTQTYANLQKKKLIT